MQAVGAGAIPAAAQPQRDAKSTEAMQLGAFSISLTVKDLDASRAFYEKFGFKPFAGNAAKKFLILKNGDHVIGLFQGTSRRTS